MKVPLGKDEAAEVKPADAKAAGAAAAAAASSDQLDAAQMMRHGKGACAGKAVIGRECSRTKTAYVT